MVIGSRKKRIETRKKCIALLQTLLQGEPKSPAEWEGLVPTRMGGYKLMYWLSINYIYKVLFIPRNLKVPYSA